MCRYLTAQELVLVSGGEGDDGGDVGDVSGIAGVGAGVPGGPNVDVSYVTQFPAFEGLPYSDPSELSPAFDKP